MNASPQHENYQREQEAQLADQEMRSSDLGGMHAESHYASYRDAAGNYVEQRQEQVQDTNQQRAYWRYWTTTIIYGILSVLEVLLILRFFFRLFGASEASGFIRFLYDLTFPLMHPFQGIFSDPAVGTQGVFEVSTLIAIVIYALITWGVVWVVNLLLRPRLPGNERMMSTRRRPW
jgi:uncharacterized protein YggT (Ycf19 family)